MSRNKRLFLFAAYDPQSIIDDALIHYVSNLATFGDVIVCTDCDLQQSEIDKLKPYTIHTISGRHGEYDFGSYKRAFLYARDNNLLKDYDFVYLVNDSVFGPMFNMKATIAKIEQITTDAAGMVVSTHKDHWYMESWFVRLNKKIFISDWFNEFMMSITKQADKTLVTRKYEHGLSNLISKHNCTWSGLYTFHGRFTYGHPKYLFKHGCPFIKKASFIRHNGEHGAQIKYILSAADKKSVNALMITANRVYGKTYMDWFLTSNPFKIFKRQITYAFKKITDNKK